MNDDKKIEECFGVEVGHNGFVESKKILKVEKKMKMKNQKYLWYKVWRSKPSNDEADTTTFRSKIRRKNPMTRGFIFLNIPKIRRIIFFVKVARSVS